MLRAALVSTVILAYGLGYRAHFVGYPSTLTLPGGSGGLSK